MNKTSSHLTLSSLALVSGCVIGALNAHAESSTIDIFENITPARIRFITAEEARANNVAHMVIKVRGKVMGICHYSRLKVEIQGKDETLIGTAGHCVDPNKYEKELGKIDYILARSLTRLYPKSSGVTFETTDKPKILERSPLFGAELHNSTVEMYGCLPDGNNKNISTCFHVQGKAYMEDGIYGKATVYFDRGDYIDLLKRTNRSCKEAVISGVSGNNFRDSKGRIVGFTSTAIQACHALNIEKTLNNKGLSVRINAFPVTFEPIRNPGNNGKTSVILN